VIYSVVPRELVRELYDELVAYYADEPHVAVIVDRRRAQERLAAPDRRRPRVAGDFPPLPADAGS
jgi:hypothetical protein